MSEVSAPVGVTTASSAVLAAVRAVPDPEIPVISIEDLGILRELSVDEQTGKVHAVITPTYSGCPAMRAIEDDIARVCRAHGFSAVVSTRLAPAWTTDWIGESAREALRRFGIAPPGLAPDLGDDAGAAPRRPVPVTIGGPRHTVACPRCGSERTSELSRFGSTACKALRRCDDCGDPFDEFKAF
ncbi:MAG: 1,2-phenylacetyl-CoA epoxidase subunit PaaD [Candidatus Phosphoribacter sp.]